MEESIINSNKSFKKFFIKIFIFLFLCSLCFSSIVFLIYGGYAKSFICQIVLKDSEIYNRVNCSNVTNTEQVSNNSKENQSKLFEQDYDSDGERISQIVEEVSSGVVGIGIIGDNYTEDQIIGTGFLVSDEALIITNRHVVEEESFNYFVNFRNGDNIVEIKNKDIFKDPVNDIAIIRIEKDSLSKNVKILNIGDSSSLRLGETVIAIGNPLGEYTGTITKGIISGLNREVKISKDFFSNQSDIYEDVIQTDAAINPGNSGGPLINMRGEVVGVNFATIDGASNLSFALPINRIKDRLNELQTYGKFKVPFLGVEYRTRIIYFKGQSIVGAQVIKVMNDSPAFKANVNIDDIIIEFDGKDLNNITLSSLIQEKSIGDEVSIVVLRNKVEKELKVIIGER